MKINLKFNKNNNNLYTLSPATPPSFPPLSPDTHTHKYIINNKYLQNKIESHLIFNSIFFSSFLETFYEYLFVLKNTYYSLLIYLLI